VALLWVAAALLALNIAYCAVKIWGDLSGSRRWLATLGALGVLGTLAALVILGRSALVWAVAQSLSSFD
jgi:hypothetical protein